MPLRQSLNTAKKTGIPTAAAAGQIKAFESPLRMETESAHTLTEAIKARVAAFFSFESFVSECAGNMGSVEHRLIRRGPLRRRAWRQLRSLCRSYRVVSSPNC